MGRRYHLEGLPSPHYMGKQGIAAAENVCNGIDLMRPKHDLRIDSHKIQVAAVILAGRMLLNLRMGSTTYIIGVHFSAESKDTLEGKMKRLMRDDVKADNF